MKRKQLNTLEAGDFDKLFFHQDFFHSVWKGELTVNIQKVNTNKGLVSRISREFIAVGKKKISNGVEK